MQIMNIKVFCQLFYDILDIISHTSTNAKRKNPIPAVCPPVPHRGERLEILPPIPRRCPSFTGAFLWQPRERGPDAPEAGKRGIAAGK